MAIATAGSDAFNNYFTAAELQALAGGNVTTATATTFVVNTNPGSIFTFTGTGFTYSPSAALTGGTITGIKIQDQGSSSVATITGLGVSAVTFWSYVQAADTDHLNLLLFSGNDTLAGGSGDDTLTGGPGNDMLVGGGGSDTAVISSYNSIIFNSDGTVTVTGSQGIDTLIGIGLLGNIQIGTELADTLTTSGHTVMAGAGDDTIVMPADQNISIDGGAGSDTLILSGAFSSYEIGDFDSALRLDTHVPNDTYLNKEIVLNNIEYIQFSDKTVQVLFGATAADGASGSSGVLPTAGGAGNNAVTTARATDTIPTTKIVNDEARGGNGGIGGSAATAGVSGANGGNGGDASLKADGIGTIIGSQVQYTGMILNSVGGDGGQGGQGSGSGAAGAGGSGGDASIELSNDTIAGDLYVEADAGAGRAMGSGGNANVQVSNLTASGQITVRAQGGASASGQSGSSSVTLDHVTDTRDVGNFQIYAGTAATVTNSTFMFGGGYNNIDLTGHALIFQNNSITGNLMQLGFTGNGAGSSLVFSGNSISAQHNSSSLRIFDSAGGTYVVNLVTGTLTVNGQSNTLTGYRNVEIDAHTNSTITGSSGDDSLTGGSGNDILIGGLGNDTLDGGDDQVNDLDTAVVSRFDSLVFNSGFVTLTGPDGTDTLRNIEMVEETDLGKTIRIGTAAADSFTTNGYDVNAGPGNDTITIAAGQTITVDGGLGNDTVVLSGASTAYQLTPGFGVITVSGLGENLSLENVEALKFSDKTVNILLDTVGAAGNNGSPEYDKYDKAGAGAAGTNVVIAASNTNAISGTGFINQAGLGGKGGAGGTAYYRTSGAGGNGGDTTLTADNLALDATKTLAGISLAATGGNGGPAGAATGPGAQGADGTGGDATAEESNDTLNSSITSEAVFFAVSTSGNSPTGQPGKASATLDHDIINLSASNAVVQLDAIARSSDDNASLVSVITNSTIGGGSATSNLTADVSLEGQLLTLQNDSITATHVNLSLVSPGSTVLFNFSGNSFVGQGSAATLAINDLAASPDQPDTYVVNMAKGTLTVNGQANSIAGFHTISITGNVDVIYAGANSGVTLTGGNGNDTLKGGAADDILVGAGGNDTLQGNAGNDALYGDGGNDILVGSTGNDLMDGGVGTDIVKTTTAAGVILAGADGNFISWSAFGMDTLRSVEQVNFPGDTYYILGTSGSDTLSAYGLGDPDNYNHGVVLAGAGDDVITDNHSGDLLSMLIDGGAGSDTLVLGVAAASATVQTRGAVTTITAEGVQTQAIHVETLQFTDQTISIAPPANPNGTFFDDGKSEDILWQNSDGSTEVWLMNGTAIIGTEQIASAASAAGKIVGTGLFNPTTKGSADIAWQNSSTGQVSVWDMNGNATLSTTTVAAPAGWTLLGTGWFDGGASSSDLIFQEADGTIAVLLDAAGDGGVVAKPAKPLTYIASADFDGDGRSDILFQDNTGQLGIWFMDGATMLSKGAVQKTLGSGSHVVATGDFNGDGKADILFQNSAGSISMWLMDGTAVTSSKVVGTPAAGWSVVAAADINGDGKSDIILQSTTGAVQAWIMNGTAVTSKTTIGSSPGSSWHIVAG